MPTEKTSSINRHHASTNFAHTLPTRLSSKKHKRTMKILLNTDYLELQCIRLEQVQNKSCLPALNITTITSIKLIAVNKKVACIKQTQCWSLYY